MLNNQDHPTGRVQPIAHIVVQFAPFAQSANLTHTCHSFPPLPPNCHYQTYTGSSQGKIRSQSSTTGDTTCTLHNFSSGSLAEMATSQSGHHNNHSVKYLTICDSKENVSSPYTDRDGYEIPNSIAPLRPKGQMAGKRGVPVLSTADQRSVDTCGDEVGASSQSACGQQTRASTKSARNCSPPPTYSQLFSPAKSPDIGRDSHCSASHFLPAKGGYNAHAHCVHIW